MDDPATYLAELEERIAANETRITRLEVLVRQWRAERLALLAARIDA